MRYEERPKVVIASMGCLQHKESEIERVNLLS